MTVPESPEAVPPHPASSPPPAEPSEQLELKLPDESAAWKDIGLWAGVLVLLTLVAFWPAVGGRFQWLDDVAVAGNTMLARPGGLERVWVQRWTDPDKYPVTTYQPVAFTANWIGYRLGGHDENGIPTPTAYHVVSLVCHAAAAVLAWLALRELAVPAAWLTAAVFALHPVNAEAVSWINDGGVPVAGALFFGSIYAYLAHLKFRERDAAEKAAGGTGGDPAQTWGLYATSAALAILAALAWPAAGGVAGVLLLALWARRRLVRLDLALLVPVLAVGVILWLANFGIGRPVIPGSSLAVADQSSLHILGLVGEGLGFAIGKVLVPVRLCVIYQNTLVGGLAALAIVGGAIAAAFVLANRDGARDGLRGVAAAAGAFAIGVVPALNWFDPARHSQQVDPLAYLAVVPLAILALAAVRAGVHRARPTLVGHTQGVVIASAVLLVLLGGGAWARAHVFDTPVHLWRDTADKRADSVFARAQYAEELRLQAGEAAAIGDVDAAKASLDDAIAAAKLATEMSPPNPVAAAAAQCTWAAALVAQGDAQQALAHYDLATRSDAVPVTPRTLVDYGQALYTLGHMPDAQRVLERAISVDPGYGAAHRVLGQTYAKLGNGQRALVEERLAVQLDPSDLAAQQLLAEALVKSGNLTEALQHYIVMLSDPSNRTRPDIWAAIAHIKDRQGAYDESAAFFRQVKQLDPKYPDVDRDLADAEAKLKRAATTRPAMTQPTTAPATVGPVTPDPSPLP